ncbi:MAG: 23S rRNA (adenine(2030)-N(6))-methyltransferase RlmJ [Proteobacteria bacterium]|nr:23S rRNA (adenine(2030)-N(6))-methyltransferase RlmJ [Pseudomonadota bacterium]
MAVELHPSDPPASTDHVAGGAPADGAAGAGPSRGSAWLADLIVRHHRAILIGALVLTALGVWRVTRLQLRSDFAELLPARDPAVVVLREMDRRIAALATLIIGVESPSPAANERFVEALVQRLRAARSSDIVAVQAGVQEEQRFFRAHRWLYAGLDQLEDAHDRLERAIAKRKNPLFVDLDDDGAKEPPLGQQADKLDQRQRERFAKFPGGYFATRDRGTYAVVISVRGSVFGGGAGERVVRLVRETTAQLQPRRFHPALAVELTGGVTSALAERHALENDLVWATTVSVVLIFLSIVLFYGRLSAVPLSTVPALIGVILALAFAQLVFGYLNSSTAFMGSIIVGNGVNYAIIQLARYEEERRFGRSVRDAIAIALHTTWRATATASLGAAVAYGSLAITSFRGFNQFGYIGGVGMVLSWLATVLVLPALWVLSDRRAAGATLPRLRGFRLAAPLARFGVEHPRLLLGLGAALSLAALIPLPRYARDPFEYDFRKLRNQVSRESASERLNARLSPVFGRSLSHNFIVADDPSQVEAIRDKLRAKDRGVGALGAVRTINDFLPGAPALQRRKLEVLGRIRALIDRNLRLLDDTERADALRLRPPEHLGVLRPGDLPYGLRRAFTEVDGTIGRPGALLRARERDGLGRALPDEAGGRRAERATRRRAADSLLRLGGGLCGDAAGDRRGWPAGHGGLAARRGALGRGADLASRRRAADPAHAACRRAVDGRRGGSGRRAHQLPQLHRAADHLWHQRRLRRQSLPTLSLRGARAGARGRRGHGRGRRALLADDDHRLRSAAGGRQSGAALLRRDGHSGRVRLHHGGVAAAAGRAGRARAAAGAPGRRAVSAAPAVPGADYSHAFHAGNVGDVWKHCVQVAVVRALVAGPRPLRVIETHAGAGRYSLGATGEWQEGIGRLLGAGGLPAAAPEALRSYLELVSNEGAGASSGPRHYPGSPRLTLALLRAADALVLHERDAATATALRAAIAVDPRISVHEADGLAGLAEPLDGDHEQLVLIDPTYADKHEWPRVGEALLAAAARQPATRFLLWYPVKSLTRPNALLAQLRAGGLAASVVELLTTPLEHQRQRLNGSGVVLVRPPPGVLEQAGAAAPILGALCATRAGWWSYRALSWEGTPRASAGP